MKSNWRDSAQITIKDTIKSTKCRGHAELFPSEHLSQIEYKKPLKYQNLFEQYVPLFARNFHSIDVLQMKLLFTVVHLYLPIQIYYPQDVVQS